MSPTDHGHTLTISESSATTEMTINDKTMNHVNDLALPIPDPHLLFLTLHMLPVSPLQRTMTGPRLTGSSHTLIVYSFTRWHGHVRQGPPRDIHAIPRPQLLAFSAKQRWNTWTQQGFLWLYRPVFLPSRLHRTRNHKNQICPCRIYLISQKCLIVGLWTYYTRRDVLNKQCFLVMYCEHDESRFKSHMSKVTHQE